MNYFATSAISLFHCVSANLAQGSVVLPGGYGETLNHYGRFKDFCFGDIERLFYEQNLEAYRVKNYPSKPSRFKGLFLCLSEAGAHKFIETQNRCQDRIYRVELVDKSIASEPHIANWLTYNPNCMSREIRTFPDGHKSQLLHNNWRTRMESYVERYWEGEDIDNCANQDNLEILTECPVKVIDRIF